MSTDLIIAVDGPAASGKGTIAARLAARFDVESEGEASAIVADRLAELAAMGLVIAA